LNIGDLFTACYSTILGTAVFADARIKEERRKEWDRVIAEVKAGVPMDEPERVERTVPDLNQAQGLSGVVGTLYSGKKTSMRRPHWDGTNFATISRSQYDLDMTLDLHLKQCLESSTGSRENPQSSELEGDWPDEVDTLGFTPREPVTRIHLDKMEEMVSKLVTRLLLQMKSSLALDGASAARNDLSLRLKEMASRIESLQRFDTRLPTYRFDEARPFASERWRLNAAIQSLFENVEADHSNLDVILAKICYNLLISTTPPNIQTYNVLIGCLNRLKLYELAQVVVDSFFNDSKFKPNSAFIRLVLDHYSMQKDAVGFRNIVNRMRAVDGDMRIKRQPLDTLTFPNVQQWALSSKVLQKRAILREKVHRDSDIFDSLINGFLRLGNLKTAVVYVKAALRERQWISARTFFCVVKACVDTLDYRAGLSLLRCVLRQGEDSTPTIIQSSLGRLAIRHLFALCGIRPSLHSERLEKPLPRMVSRDAIHSLLRLMRMESLGASIDRFAARIGDVKYALGLAESGPALEPDELVEKGDTKAGRFGQIDIRGLRKATEILRTGSHFEQRRIRQRHLNEEQYAMQRKVETTECKPWLVVLYQKLPEKWKKMYDNSVELIPDMPWSDRLELLSSFSCGRQITPDHPIYSKLREMSCKKLEPPLRRQQEVTRVEESQADAANTEQTPTVVFELPSQEKSDVPLPIQSKRQHEAISVEISLPAPSKPPARSTLALTIPLGATHDDALLEASAVCHIGEERDGDFISDTRVSMMYI
jgi:hypothetical protein